MGMPVIARARYAAEIRRGEVRVTRDGRAAVEVWTDLRDWAYVPFRQFERLAMTLRRDPTDMSRLTLRDGSNVVEYLHGKKARFHLTVRRATKSDRLVYVSNLMEIIDG